MGRILGQELRVARLPPDVDLFEVEPCGPHEDANGQVVDTRLQDVERDGRHAILPLSRWVVFLAVGGEPVPLVGGRLPATVRIPGRAVVRERRTRPQHEGLDRICEMRLGDVVVAALDAEPVCLEQDLARA